VSINPVVEKVLKELKFNPDDCLWKKHSAICMKHRYIEIAGQEKGVLIQSLDEVVKDSANGVVAIKCTASLGKTKVITYGEASPKNNTNSYPFAMAEKRAIDRAILKLIGIHGFVYSEDEVEENFEKPQPVVKAKPITKTKPKPKPVFKDPSEFVNAFKKIITTESKNAKNQKFFEDNIQPYLSKYDGDLNQLESHSKTLHKKLQQHYTDSKATINNRK